jgi:hypothetical protein
MQIKGTTFGSITIDGKTYEHDIVIRLSGEVVKRKKKLSKKYYGCELLIFGSGQEGNVHLSPEAESYFAKKDCRVFTAAEAINLFNKSRAKKVGLFHVTC